MKKNRKILSIGAVLALFCLFLAPATLPAATTTCGSTTFDVYLAPGYTCQTGGIEFSAFGYSSVGVPNGVAPPASGVIVTPITTDGNVGFRWHLGLGGATQPNGSSMFQDVLLTYTATALPGTKITDLHLFFNGGFTGTGATAVTENYCLNGPLLGCAPENAGQISTTNPPANFNDAAFFPGVDSISVSKDVLCISGTDGTCNISHVENTVSYGDVPEPATLALVGFALMGAGLYHRRWQ